MKRTPFLLLAALGAGVPIAFAFSPCCDHKGNCKHKQASVATAGQSPAVDVVGTHAAHVATPLSRVAPSTSGQSGSSCTSAPSVVTLAPAAAGGGIQAGQVVEVRPSKSSTRRATITVPSGTVHGSASAQGGGGSSSCTVTSSGTSAGSCAPSAVTTVSPRGQSTLRALSAGGGVTVLTTDEALKLDEVSGTLATLDTLEGLTTESGLQVFNAGDASLIAIEGNDPQVANHAQKAQQEYRLRLNEAEVTMRQAQETVRKMQAEQRAAQQEARRDYESSLREMRKEQAAQTREAQQALERYSDWNAAQKKVAAAKRDAEVAEQHAAAAKAKIARKYAGQDAQVALLRKAEAQGAKDKQARESEAKLFKKLSAAGGAAGAGGIDRTHDLERRIAELERELAELRAQRGERAAPPARMRKFKFDASGDVHELHESSADGEDERDADGEKDGGQSFWQSFDKSPEGAASGFSAWKTAPPAPMPPPAPPAPRASTPPLPGAAPEAPMAPAPPASPWSALGGIARTPDVAPVPPPADFDIATQWRAAALAPLQPLPGGGELEDAMRELRDEIRALRDSMQGLRDRIHSMAEDNAR